MFRSGALVKIRKSKSNVNNPLNRRAVINIFLNKIYLYDDKFRLILNGSGQAVEIDNIMLDEMVDYFDSQSSDLAECSSVVADAPPNKNESYDTIGIATFVLFLFSKMPVTQGFLAVGHKR